MKKIILVVAMAALVIGVSSCKTHEKCPAYGSKTTPTTTASAASKA